MISNVIMWRSRIHKMGDVRQVHVLIQSGIVVNEISNKYGRGGILISSNVSLSTSGYELTAGPRTMPCWKRMTNPKFCYHLGCLKTSCNMQHDMDNLLVSVLETMTFYKGANLIFSSQFSDMCSVLHLTVLTAMMFWDFVPFSLSKLHQLEAFSMTFPLKHL
jgi:hypothetical protein